MALHVLLQPGPKAWPLTQQGLVGHLHRVLGLREQPVLREAGQHGRRVRVARRVELVELDPPTRDGFPLAGGDQAEEHAPGRLPLAGGGGGSPCEVWASRETPPRTPPVCSWASIRIHPSSRVCHSSTSAVDRSGNPPASSDTSSTRASARADSP